MKVKKLIVDVRMAGRPFSFSDLVRAEYPEASRNSRLIQGVPVKDLPQPMLKPPRA